MADTDVLRALRTAATAAGQRVAPSVVRVGRQGGRGCGLVVAEGHVLTNGHNLRDRTTEITFGDGRAVQGEVTAAEPDGDIAVLAVDTAAVPPVEWAATASEVGDVVFAVARTAGGDERLSFGLVSGLGRAFRGPGGRRVTGSLEHTAPLARGSSGSPVVDEDGRLVGLNTARLGEGFYLARPADATLRERVDALIRGEAPRRRVLGVGLARPDVAARLRASVGLPDHPGLLVRAVADDSPAARAGLLVGDLLVTAAGRDLRTVDDLHEVLTALGDDQDLEITALRGTDDLTVTVTFPS